MSLLLLYGQRVSSGTIAEAAFDFSQAASTSWTGASINASALALTQNAALTLQGAALAEAKADTQQSAALDWGATFITVSAAAFDWSQTSLWAPETSAIAGSSIDLAQTAQLIFEGAEAGGGTIAAAEFGIEAEAELSFQGQGAPANTVVTLGADKWRIERQRDIEEEAELMALMEQIIPMAVAHRTGLQVRR